MARRLGRALSGRGDRVTGLIRNPDQSRDLHRDGVEPVVLDLERTDPEEVAGHLGGADAVVFAAGAGGSSGDARKETVDRGAAVLLADAAQAAGVSRYLLLSSVGVESVRGDTRPDGIGEGFLAYLRAKLAAEEDLRARDGLDLTVLRPVTLTDDAGTGRVQLADMAALDSELGGQVTRDDVAAVLAALLDAPTTAGLVLELAGGDDPLADAVRDVSATG